MGRTGFFARLLAGRTSRALGALGAYLLAAQAMALPLLTAEPAGCCCARRSTEQRCTCKSCTHARALEAGQPQLETCGTPAQAALPPPPAPFALPAAAPLPFAVPQPRPVAADPAPPPDPTLEVRTPPPLARA